MKPWILASSAVVALGAMTVGAGFFMTSKWRAEATLLIDAPPERIFENIVDLRQWRNWTVWNRDMDPTLEWTFAGPEQAKGSEMTWQGDELGRGRLVVTEVEPNRMLTYDLFFDRATRPNHGTLVLEPFEGKTRVSWLDEGDVGSNPIGRLVVAAIEKTVARDFQLSLEKLKVRVEATP